MSVRMSRRPPEVLVLPSCQGVVAMAARTWRLVVNVLRLNCTLARSLKYSRPTRMLLVPTLSRWQIPCVKLRTFCQLLRLILPEESRTNTTSASPEHSGAQRGKVTLRSDMYLVYNLPHIQTQRYVEMYMIV